MGDTGYVDENGLLFLVGRIKETITLKNAKKINASLVESILSGNAMVEEIAAKGAANEKGYDDIHIFIRTR